MKRTALTLFFCLAAVAPLLADDVAPVADTTTNESPFHNDRQRAGYALGMMISHSWQQQGVDVDFDAFIRGFKDVQSGGATLMTPQEVQTTLAAYQKVVLAKQQKMREDIAAKNKAEGEAYLAANKKKPDVKTLPDGLQYKIVSEGTGPMPGSNDVVLVNYRGSFLDGTEFDSTARLGHPAEVPLPSAIEGWREALTMMRAGSVWELYVPAQLAYKEAGRPPLMPANATLLFTVQLISSGPPGSALLSAISNPPLTSDIIAVPSAADLKKGKQPYTLKPEDVQKMQKQFQKTNSTSR